MSAHTTGLSEAATGSRNDRIVHLTGAARHTSSEAVEVSNPQQLQRDAIPQPSAIRSEPSRRGFAAMLEGFRASGGTGNHPPAKPGAFGM